ncbi:MAG: VOC family protein [Caulobacteraceae bacterium]|nr:VOC family protein [Caulobacter sp.]
MSEPMVGGVMPYLTVVGGVRAIEFYRQAFEAVEFARHMADDGVRVLNSHLGINGGSIMLSDHFREFHGDASAPPPAGVVLHLQVDDADAWFARALDAGCTEIMPLGDQFWGDRYGRVKDPFGHTWSIAHTLAQAG